MRKSRKSKFPDIDRRKNARKGKEMGWLNFQPLHVSRWPWSDQMLFWTWRDSQREFFEAQKRKRIGKQLMVLTGLLTLIGLTIWAFI